MAKVSIIMPSLNVGSYIKQCIDSVMKQSLRDMEIICVDAGSTDGTLEILKEAAEKDPRIKIVISDKKSYGYQMNIGLEVSEGEYIGIVETDDYVNEDMFLTLYEIAKKDDLDVVKSDFWFYYSKPADKNTLYKIPKCYTGKGVFCPLTDFDDKNEQAGLFNIKPSIWSAIYKKDFLTENDIKFNETDGAAFQDSGFNFKVWACAKRVRLIPDAFLHYRQDNEQSSVNSKSKAYCICEEYKEMENFINSRFEGEDRKKLSGIMMRLKYDGYLWNYGRLEKPLNEEFIYSASSEFADDFEKGYASKEYFVSFKWENLLLWVRNPGELIKVIEKQNNRSLIGKAVSRITRIISR